MSTKISLINRYAYHLLSIQSDFCSSKYEIEEFINNSFHGHYYLILYYLKYYYKVNSIEYF